MKNYLFLPAIIFFALPLLAQVPYNSAVPAAAVIKSALPFGNAGQLQQLGRQLIAAKNPKAALEVFQFNYDKNPSQFAALVGMTRGLSASGEYARALEFANKALPLAPNDANKQAVQAMIEKLKARTSINFL